MGLLIIISIVSFALVATLLADSVGRYLNYLKSPENRPRIDSGGGRPSGSFRGFLDFISDDDKGFWGWRRYKKPLHEELMRVLMRLDENSLETLFQLYKEEFGIGPARYARKTYKKWEKGNVRPQQQTFERFLVHLPKVMSYDLKCEVLRKLMEEYGTADNYDLTVYTDDWSETLEPLVKKLIDKPYNAVLPKQIEDSLNWLADDEMQIAESILKRSQVEEGRIAVSMLRDEFSNIEHLLETAAGRSTVRHTLKFPYGTINLKIKRR
ncbi:MAG: hypothetical protein KDB79_01955 [Acidobacteria bacterium]|nr:hypothetical protein [Acidobacteriota bacterium]